MTLTRLKQILADKLNPEEILERFDIQSEELLEEFSERVDLQFEELVKEFGDEDEETEDDDYHSGE